MKSKLDFIKVLVKKSKKCIAESEDYEDSDLDAAISKVGDAQLFVKKAKELLEAAEEENNESG